MNKRDWKKEYEINKDLFDIEIGDEIQINPNLIATVVNVSNPHGKCFQLQLPMEDFLDEKFRTFWINAEELAGYRKIYTIK